MKLHIYFWKSQVKSFIELNNRVIKMYEDTKIDKDELWEKYTNEINEKIEKIGSTMNFEYQDSSDLADIYNDLMSDYADLFWHIVHNHLYQYLVMIFQTWENRLISFVVNDLKDSGYIIEKQPVYGEIIEFIKSSLGGSKIQGLDEITELRILVNVIKHGEGHAANRLRKKRPDFFSFDDNEGLGKFNDRLKVYDSVFLNGNALNVKESDLYSYHKSITDFWDSIPERVYF